VTDFSSGDKSGDMKKPNNKSPIYTKINDCHRVTGHGFVFIYGRIFASPSLFHAERLLGIPTPVVSFPHSVFSPGTVLDGPFLMTIGDTGYKFL
jgi:hypothetical protein